MALNEDEAFKMFKREQLKLHKAGELAETKGMKQPQATKVIQASWDKMSMDDKVRFDQEARDRAEDERLMKKIKGMSPLQLYKIHMKVEMPELKPQAVGKAWLNLEQKQRDHFEKLLKSDLDEVKRIIVDSENSGKSSETASSPRQVAYRAFNKQWRLDGKDWRVIPDEWKKLSEEEKQKWVNHKPEAKSSKVSSGSSAPEKAKPKQQEPEKPKATPKPKTVETPEPEKPKQPEKQPEIKPEPVPEKQPEPAPAAKDLTPQQAKKEEQKIIDKIMKKVEQCEQED